MGVVLVQVCCMSVDVPEGVLMLSHKAAVSPQASRGGMGNALRVFLERPGKQ